MSNSYVKLESFTKKYESKFACDCMDFEAAENSITGLLGPNGAGKTTLLKAISGNVYPTSGSVSVCGFTNPDDIKKVTGYVPEVPELEENLTVKETLLLEAKLHSVKDAKKSVMEAVETCGLNDVLHQKVKAISKGFRQRTSLAKAICTCPKVLILDEFSSGLDPSQNFQLKEQIKKLSKKTSIIFSTHHMEEASSLCDFIYILNEGKIAEHGTLGAILKKNNSRNLEEAFLKAIKKEG